MWLIYRGVLNIFLGIFIFLFYQKIIAAPPKQTLFTISASLVFTIYRLISHAYIPEPFRAILGLFILGLFIWIWKRSISASALTLSFLIGYSALIVSTFIGSVLALPLGLVETDMFFTIFLFLDTATYIAFYKLIKLKNGIPSIDDTEIKGIIFSITGIILALFGGYHATLNRVEHGNEPLFFYTSMLALFSVIVALVFLILHLQRRHRERREFAKIKLALDELAERHHKYKEVIPVAGASVSAFSAVLTLIDGIKNMLEKDKLGQIESLKQCLDSVNRLTTELGDELAIDGIDATTRELLLPDEWFSMGIHLQRLMIRCKANDIPFFVKNTASHKLWNNLQLSQSEFLRLVGNLVGNAIKELSKMENEGKQVLVAFLDESGVFVLEVRDNAHQFPLEVLANLGKRGNSTNGTGNGYAEIFDFLAKSCASIEIAEDCDTDDNFNRKMIRIVFDKSNRRIIRTTYRYALLKKALAETALSVEVWA